MKKETGRLIVFEGVDGAGKSTQVARLCARLEGEGYPHRRLVFPRYEAESSTLIRMYLRGDFGKNPADVNPYAATAFYAVDRYASYRQDWGRDYRAGSLCVADRYTTSNAVHQAAKLEDPLRQEYLAWLSDFEYGRMGLPAPDLVIFLDLPTQTAVQRIGQRGNEGADIHEGDLAYLAACRDAALAVSAQEGWLVLSCVDEAGELRSVEDIHESIWQAILPYVNQGSEA